MKKTVIALLVVGSLVLLGNGISYAVQGQCAGCHTMHASQNGTFPTGMTSGPNPYLLVADCIPCHTQNGAGQLSTNTFGAPIVWHTTSPGSSGTDQGAGKTNAGGDFYWVANGTDSMGHNVAGIAGQDQVIAQGGPGLTPPGWDASATPGALNDGQINAGAGSWSTAQLGCAGTYGCHGRHDASGDMPGIKGAHHDNPNISRTQADTPTTIGRSYRFLGGINGLEDTFWNWNETDSNHNEYFGVNGNSSYTNKRTISYSCAKCHGVFHSSIGTASPWLRHPTDVDLPAYGEYNSYNPDDGGVYSIEAPVGRPTVYSSSNNTVTEGTDIVICMSCHRAHGSPVADLVRWDYSGIIAGSGTADTGCFRCHTGKNADQP